MAATGGPVFVKKIEGQKIDTAFTVLIDCSGSMSGHPLKLACDAALATTLAFDLPEVKSRVLAFPAYVPGEVNPADCANYSVKQWNERPSAPVKDYQWLEAGGGTPLAQAAFGACMELIRRKESRKILLVATDGVPDHIESARWVIDLARASGIQVLGLGIRHDTDSLFGVNSSRRVDSLGELSTAMIDLMSSAMGMGVP